MSKTKKTLDIKEETKKLWLSHVSNYREDLIEQKEHLNYKLKNKKKSIQVVLKSNEALIIRNINLSKEITKLQNIIIKMKRKMKEL